MTTSVKFQLRRDTATNWSTNNTILLLGEPGFDSTSNQLRIGDGVTGWNSLNQVHVKGNGGLALGYVAGYTGQGASAISIGNRAGEYAQGTQSIAIGANAGQTGQGNYSIAIGANAGQTGQAGNSIAIGSSAGSTGQDANSVAIGTFAGMTRQKESSVAIGLYAGSSEQKANAVAIGTSAGNVNQQANSIAVGINAGSTNQSLSAIAIGVNAGFTGQGTNSIAIGSSAGFTGQANNTIILNATGNRLSGVVAQTDSFYVAPVRNYANENTFSPIGYNPTTNEVGYAAPRCGIHTCIAGTTQVITITGLTTSGVVGLTYIHPPGGGAGQFFVSSTPTANTLTVELGQTATTAESIIWIVGKL